jgi:hydrogenase expression/formation protein HypE
LNNTDFTLSCPIPIKDYPIVTLAHGSGGKLMGQLIDKMFVSTFAKKSLKECHDAAVIENPGGKLAFTTDSFVIHPLIFPGGDIGKLAVCGTVNDLAMSGARPLYLSLGLILEEGLSMETLWTIVQSIKAAADEAGVAIVTGDTKVVDKGKGDGIFINTAGIGAIDHDLAITPGSVEPGDAVIVNGDLGRHGMAVMAVREGLEFESAIESDTAPLHNLVAALLEAGVAVHCLRDLTRGGLASALNEIAQAAGLGIEIDESAVPVRDDVAAACEILGLDPLYVANEAKFVAFIPEKDKNKALEIMQANGQGRDAAVIGKVADVAAGIVQLNSKIGAKRILDMLSGEQLPRIC